MYEQQQTWSTYLAQAAHDEVAVPFLVDNGARAEVDVVQGQLHERGQTAQPQQVANGNDRVSGEAEVLSRRVPSPSRRVLTRWLKNEK